MVASESSRILVIDDDDVDRKAVRRMLKRAGLDGDFHEATDGAAGMAALIGIEKGKPFAPDADLRKILTEAERVAWAMCTSLAFASEVPNARAYDDRQWEYCFLTDSPSFVMPILCTSRASPTSIGPEDLADMEAKTLPETVDGDAGGRVRVGSAF